MDGPIVMVVIGESSSETLLLTNRIKITFVISGKMREKKGIEKNPQGFQPPQH